MEKQFEKATREKLRVNFKGLVSTEDLWDMRLEDLDTLYGQVTEKLEKFEGKSLLRKVGRKTKEEEHLRLSAEIIKHIVEVKLAEQEARKEAKANRELKQRLLAIKEKKQFESFENMSEEELDKKIAEL